MPYLAKSVGEKGGKRKLTRRKLRSASAHKRKKSLPSRHHLLLEKDPRTGQETRQNSPMSRGKTKTRECLARWKNTKSILKKIRECLAKKIKLANVSQAQKPKRYLKKNRECLAKKRKLANVSRKDGRTFRRSRRRLARLRARPRGGPLLRAARGGGRAAPPLFLFANGRRKLQDLFRRVPAERGAWRPRRAQRVCRTADSERRCCEPAAECAARDAIVLRNNVRNSIAI